MIAEQEKALDDAASQPVEVLIEEVRRRTRRRRRWIGAAVAVAALVLGISLVLVNGGGTSANPPIATFHGTGSPVGTPITTMSFAVVGRGITELRWNFTEELTVEILNTSSQDARTGAIPGVLQGATYVISNEGEGIPVGPLGVGTDFGTPRRGSVAMTLVPGVYRLQVSATGPWRIDVVEPRNQTANSTPTTWHGSGAEVIGPFNAGSAIQLRVTVNYKVGTRPGGDAFDVEVFSASSGRALAIALRRVGLFTTTATTNDLSGGPYYLGVFAEASESWTITALQAAA